LFNHLIVEYPASTLHTIGAIANQLMAGVNPMVPEALSRWRRHSATAIIYRGDFLDNLSRQIRLARPEEHRMAHFEDGYARFR
jgi:hypothetical protein